VKGFNRPTVPGHELPSGDGYYWVFYRDYRDGSQTPISLLLRPQERLEERRMRALPIIAALALSSAAGLAQPEPTAPLQPAQELAGPCLMPKDDFLARLAGMAAQDSRFEVIVFAGERAQKLMETLNAAPPPTSYTAESIVAFLRSSDEDPAAIVFLLDKVCVTHAFGPMPMRVWTELRNRALGVEARANGEWRIGSGR
jgi:hypothetical protein